MSENRRPLALVTGGSRGIGASIALRLAEDGFHVLINYSSSRDRAESILEQIKRSGGSGSLLPFDVAESAQVDEQMDQARKSFGPLSVLVNNAGINVDSLLIRMKDTDLDRTLAVDLKGAIYCTRAASKQMMRERSGSIIQISSVVGEAGSAGQSAYAAAKSGLIGFSKSIAKELGSRNVRINVVTPGYITTEMTETLTESQKEAILRTVPLGFLCCS